MGRSMLVQFVRSACRSACALLLIHSGLAGAQTTEDALTLEQAVMRSLAGSLDLKAQEFETKAQQADVHRRRIEIERLTGASLGGGSLQ